MTEVRMWNGGWDDVPDSFLFSSMGKTWEELIFLGKATTGELANLLEMKKDTLIRQLKKLSRFGLVRIKTFNNDQDWEVVAEPFDSFDMNEYLKFRQAERCTCNRQRAESRR